MEVRPFEDPGPFAQSAEPYFDENPFTSNVITVVVHNTRAGTRPRGPDDGWWTVMDGRQVVGTAMHTPPFKLFLSQMPEEAAGALARALAHSERQLAGMSGESQTVRAFADAWDRLTGQSSRVEVFMRMYRLGELRGPVGVRGEPVAASQGDAELVASWLGAFHDEAQPHAPIDDWNALARRRITTGQFRLWRDGEGEAVSVAGFSTPVAGVARVGPVYTPPNWRGQGFGSAVTADATASAQVAGARHVVLYTDLANPTSNAIYQAIGYEADHDAEERVFEPSSEPEVVSTGAAPGRSKP
jgi:RimJ/RimL family protein N-acetyltransferase